MKDEAIQVTDPGETALKLLAQCNGLGANMIKVILRDANDHPLSAVFVVMGAEQTAECVTALESIEAFWD